MKILLLALLVGCATTTLPSRAPDDVCYSKAEKARVNEAMEEQDDVIDDLRAQLRSERRENEKWHTRNEGLKGYCI